MYTGKRNTTSEYIQFSKVHKKLYIHCFRVCNKGVKEVRRH